VEWELDKEALPETDAEPKTAVPLGVLEAVMLLLEDRDFVLVSVTVALLLWVLELVALTENERVGDKVPVTEVEKVVVGEFVKEPDGEEDLVFPP